MGKGFNEGENRRRKKHKGNIKKNKKNENEEFKEMIYPELNYDTELEQLFTAVTRLKIDNQNLINFKESKNLKDPEVKILKERFQDDFEILQTCIKTFDPIQGNGSQDLKMINQKKIVRNSSYENLNINDNNINDNMNLNNDIKLKNIPRGRFNQDPNREEDDYSIVKDDSKNEPLICSGENFMKWMKI